MKNIIKLATIATQDGPVAAVISGHRAVPAAPATGAKTDGSILDMLLDWDATLTRLDGIDWASQPGLDLSTTTLLPPVLRPGVIYCAGANYMDHAAEMAATRNMPPPPDPHTLSEHSWHVIKSAHALTANGATVEMPDHADYLDWEAELAVVIGRKGKNISAADALNHVAGYTIANDLSARDLNKRARISEQSPFRFDWVSHKNFDGACPMGPWISLARDTGNPADLDISLSVNGEIKQKSNSGQMIFTIEEQIVDLSRRMTLWPGDIILTGTPAGVGHASGQKLKAGDRVVVSIAGIGELVTKMV